MLDWVDKGLLGWWLGGDDSGGWFDDRSFRDGNFFFLKRVFPIVRGALIADIGTLFFFFFFSLVRFLFLDGAGRGWP
jgi:hypothetical protein